MRIREMLCEVPMVSHTYEARRRADRRAHWGLQAVSLTISCVMRRTVRCISVITISPTEPDTTLLPKSHSQRLNAVVSLGRESQLT